jgi:hypothetical protein
LDKGKLKNREKFFSNHTRSTTISVSITCSFMTIYFYLLLFISIYFYLFLFISIYFYLFLFISIYFYLFSFLIIYHYQFFTLTVTMATAQCYFTNSKIRVSHTCLSRLPNTFLFLYTQLFSDDWTENSTRGEYLKQGARRYGMRSGRRGLLTSIDAGRRFWRASFSRDSSCGD